MFKYRSFTHIRNNVLEHYIEGYVLPFTLKLNLSQSLYPLFLHIFDTFLLKKKKKKEETISILCSLQDFPFFFFKFQILLKKFLPFPFFVSMKFHSSRIFKTNVPTYPPSSCKESFPFVNSCVKLILCCIIM